MRKLNEMFHTDDEGFLVKTSNGQRVPADEPIFILRARDMLALLALDAYQGALREHGCDADRIRQHAEVVKEFENFMTVHPDRMKQPGITKGK
jgi:hypothetical protein